MAEGWGQDFDEDGNVIGEVPEDDPTFFSEHKYKIIAVVGVWLLLGLPQAAEGGIGGLIAGTAVAVFFGSLFVYLGVGVSKRL